MSAKKTSNHNYIIVLKIDEMNVGSQYQNELHCTAFLWFSSTSEREEVANLVNQVALEFSGIELSPTGTANFGSKESPMEVTLVEKTPEIAHLHDSLHKRLSNLSDFKLLEPQFTGEAWRPHVTTQNDKKLNSKVISKSLYVIEARGDLKTDPKYVLAEVELGK